MKIISNFEVLFNRIAPASSGSIARKVIQGHFLTISNTELHRSVYFKVKYTYGNNIPNTSDSDRELRIATLGPNPVAGNTTLIYDGGSINNQSIPTSATTTANGVNIPGGDYFYVATNNLRLRAGETGLLALLPFPQPTGVENTLTDTSPSLEVRGFITIEQVSDAQYVNSNNQLITETNPFVNQEAKLLICSEHRGTFIDEDFDGSRTEFQFGNGIKVGFDFDQLAYPLPLAEGKSLYILDGA